MQNFKIGDPLDSSTEIGPLARKDLLESLHKQVLDTINSGAKCIIGGKPLKQAGFFYPATILTDVTKDMEAYKEELFGPVAIIIKAKSNDEAINIANDSLYGLGAAIFSNDIKKAESIAKKELQAGTCCVNTLVKSDPKFAFGGIKQSGYGRELGKFGMHEFVNIKTVHVYKP